MSLLKFTTYLSFLFFFVSCTGGAGIKTQLASESLMEQRTFCNPIRSQGFEGVLAVNTSGNNWIHQAESAILQFQDVPDYFKNTDHSYIQMFAFNYQKNKMIRDNLPLSLDVYNLDTHDLIQTTKYIDTTLANRENRNVDEFFFKHIFVVKDIVGWQGVILGLFNDIDKNVVLLKILNPPFDANPHIYKTRYAQDFNLHSLHPFKDFLSTTDPEENTLFLSKSRDACLELSGVSFDFYGGSSI